ncbi:Hsp70 family protein [Actinomadura latina]|uniref:Hsp70 family protein n=1 Tax=Actinomadura latina TaxID=163603 RepID=A0A846Z0D8_9ACTN|nr:Hsp70 family protein [Actinomadura latina]NKZ06299.1 Hsp70 family protein [Actinomadura latina]
MAKAADHAIGIDFGTSTSLLAERSALSPVGIVPLGHSTNWLPSLAGIDAGRLLIGEDAENLPVDQTVRSVKRTITERRDHVEISTDAETRTVDADEIIVALLREIGGRAEAAGTPLRTEEEVRLGCPAMWDGEQRGRLLTLADRAGLPVTISSLVDEPISAGIAWVTHRYLAHRHSPEGRLLVFDMGGGTLDIGVLDVDGGAHPKISVLAAAGVDQAGDALDRAIADELLQELADKRFDAAAHPQGRMLEAVMLREAREAKVRLSRQERDQIVVRGLGARLGLPTLTFERAHLEELFRPQMADAEEFIWAALRAAKLTGLPSPSPSELRAMGPDELSGDVDFVLLTGGMSRIPYVERRIGELFPKAQVFDDAGVGAEEAVAAGLSDTTAYERLNLLRPGFDFVLEYTEGGRSHVETIYPAHTPFYEPWEAMSKSVLGFECHGADFPGPGRGTGGLRVRSTSGEYLTLQYEGKEMAGIELRLGPGMLFKMYPNGQLVVRDATQQELNLRVVGWPIIRGPGYHSLVMEQYRPGDSSPRAADFVKEYAPPHLL